MSEQLDPKLALLIEEEDYASILQWLNQETITGIEPKGLYNLGNECAGQGKFNLAISLYQKSISIEPDSSTYNNMGTSYKRLGMFAEAESCYKAAVNLDPTYITAYIRLAQLHVKMGCPERALQDLDAYFSAKGNPVHAVKLIQGEGRSELAAMLADHFDIRCGTCEHFSVDESSEEEMGYCTAPGLWETPTMVHYMDYICIDSEADSSWRPTWGLQGTTSARMGRIDIISRSLKLTSKASPTIKPLIQKGEEAAAAGNPLEAIAWFSSAIGEAPDDPIGYIGRGNQIALTVKSKDDLETIALALTEFNAAIRLDPNRWEAYLGRAFVNLVIRGYLDQAYENLNKALSLNPRSFEAYLYRGGLYIQTGNFEAAVRDLTEAISIFPYSHEALSTRAMAYHALQDYDKAIRDFSFAIELNPEDADLHLFRGSLYHSQGDLPNALVDYEVAVKLNPTEENIHDLFTIRYQLATELGIAEGDAFPSTVSKGTQLAITLGNAFWFAKNVELAALEMQSALWESDFIQDPTTRVLIKSQVATTLARMYVALGQLDGAIELCQGSLNIIDQPGYLSVSTTHEILSVIHALRQDWDKAVYHYNQYGQSLPQSDRDNPANRRSEWDMIAEAVTDKQYLRALRTAEKELDKRVGKKFWFW